MNNEAIEPVELSTKSLNADIAKLFINPMKEYIESLNIVIANDIIEPIVKNNNEYLKTVMHDLSEKLREPLILMGEDFQKQFSEMFHQLYQDTSPVINAIKKTMDNASDYDKISMLKKIDLFRVEKLFDEIKDEDYNYLVNANGTISTKTETAKTNTINNYFIDQVNFFSCDEVADEINRLVLATEKDSINSREVSGCKKITIENIVSILTIVYMLLSIASNIGAFISQKQPIFEYQNKQTISSELVSRNFRIVNADTLNVRQSNSTKSTIVGELHANSLVRVIYKKKNWTFIEWTSPDNDASIRGWVFTRYISKFK